MFVKRDSDSYSFIFRTDLSLQTETNKVLPIYLNIIKNMR